jgi:hypothetical protein
MHGHEWSDGGVAVLFHAAAHFLKRRLPGGEVASEKPGGLVDLPSTESAAALFSDAITFQCPIYAKFCSCIACVAGVAWQAGSRAV